MTQRASGPRKFRLIEAADGLIFALTLVHPVYGAMALWVSVSISSLWERTALDRRTQRR